VLGLLDNVFMVKLERPKIGLALGIAAVQGGWRILALLKPWKKIIFLLILLPVQVLELWLAVFMRPDWILRKWKR